MNHVTDRLNHVKAIPITTDSGAVYTPTTTYASRPYWASSFVPVVRAGVVLALEP